MIRLCHDKDIDTIHQIINDSARAYGGHIPEDCYHEPYMPKDELLSEIADGVVFYGYEEDGHLVAVMGIQDKGPVILIRHAYTSTDKRGRGIGSSLLEHLLGMTTKPVLIGTWRDAEWAIRFYQRHGFRLVSEDQKDRLLRQYWSIPERQAVTSVVLVDAQYQEELASG
ncbi:MAG TPA: GNAT family N-acetyltransferase [Anaerolineae bacterium]|nr:GNAT family N-acetyltransferase [Anaerolineae bacterium]